MQKYLFGSYDMNCCRFISQKGGSYRIKYIDNQDKYTNIIYKTPIIKVPFGVEEYAKKDIINLEFTDYQKNNDVFNFITQIEQLDDFLSRLQNIDDNNDEFFSKSFVFNINKDVLYDIKGKQYVSCIRRNKGIYDPSLRTHLRKKGKTIQSKVYKQKEQISVFDIKKHFGFFTIELGTLWTSSDQYGLVIYFNGGYLC